MWALAQNNFLLVWNYHTPGEGKGPVDTDTPVALGGSKLGKGGNKTQAVVDKLVQYLPKSSYHLWLDNLFTSTRFLEYMRNHREVGISGTCRLNAGILSEILDLNRHDKAKSGDNVPWGEVLSLPTKSNQICQVAWKDSSLALMMSTVEEGTVDVEVERRRPKQRKKKEEQKHKPFKGQATKTLRIPAIFYHYNMLMGAVDVFDHLTAMNAGLRRVRRGAWQALEHWLLRTVLANTYAIG